MTSLAVPKPPQQQNLLFAARRQQKAEGSASKAPRECREATPVSHHDKSAGLESWESLAIAPEPQRPANMALQKQRAAVPKRPSDRQVSASSRPTPEEAQSNGLEVHATGTISARGDSIPANPPKAQNRAATPRHALEKPGNRAKVATDDELERSNPRSRCAPGAGKALLPPAPRHRHRNQPPPVQHRAVASFAHRPRPNDLPRPPRTRPTALNARLPSSCTVR